MGDMYEFQTDRINVFSLVLDCSGSMRCHQEDMREGLRLYKESFENFSEGDSIAIAVNKFGDYYYSSAFKGVNDFDYSYSSSNECTCLCYSICKGANQLLDYIENLINKLNCTPRATFIVFSDGQPCNDKASFDDAKKAINKLNNAGVTTVFVAFGSGTSVELGESLGFISTKEIEDKSTLTQFMGVELSKSCKEQSKSLKALGSNFFSQAINGNSENFSQKTEQAIEDDDWFRNL